MNTDPPAPAAWPKPEEFSVMLTRKLVDGRAVELAMTHGHSASAVSVAFNFGWREYFDDAPNELHSVRRHSSVCLNEAISAKLL